MALPANFPQPPKRPPASVPITDGAWIRYFDALDRFNAEVRAYLATLA